MGVGLAWGVSGVLVGLCSFFADFCFLKHESSSVRKLWFALDLFFIYLYVAMTIPFMFARGLEITPEDNRQLVYFCWAALALLSLYLSRIVVLAFSGKAHSPEQWEFRHSMWHLFITTISVLAFGGSSEEYERWYRCDGAVEVLICVCTVAVVMQLSITAVVLYNDDSNVHQETLARIRESQAEAADGATGDVQLHVEMDWHYAQSAVEATSGGKSTEFKSLPSVSPAASPGLTGGGPESPGPSPILQGGDAEDPEPVLNV